MIKMYQAQGEFEQSLNSIGYKQNELIKKHIRTQEWYLFDKGGGGSTEKPNPQSLNSHPLMSAISSSLSISSPQNTKEEKIGPIPLYFSLFPSISFYLSQYFSFIVSLSVILLSLNKKEVSKFCVQNFLILFIFF